MTGTPYTYASELTEVGLGLELATNVGNPVAPTVQLVVSAAPDSSDVIGAVEDNGLRGLMVETYDIIPGTASSLVSLSGPVMADTFPWLLANILGDTVYQGTATGSATTLATGGTAVGATSAPCVASIASGTLIQIGVGMAAEVRLTTGVSGPGPYTVTWSAAEPLKVAHIATTPVTPITSAYTTIQSLLNGGGYGGQAQPPTLTITDLNQVSANFGRQYAGWSADTLTIKASPNGLLTFEAKGMGWPSNVLASVPNLALSSVEASAGWNSTVSLAGSAVSNITEWELDLARKVSIVETTDGTQGPYAIRRGAFSAATKFRAAAADESPLLNYLQNTNVAIVYGISNGLSGAAQLSHSFNLPKNKYVNGTKIDRSKEEVGFSVEAKCLPSTSAAGWSGGASQVQVTTVNATPSRTYSL